MATKKKTKKKKGGKGKRIGGAFERRIKKLIVESFEPFGIQHTDAFRSEGSGFGKHAFGDISLSPALSALFPFAVECKSRKKVQLFDFLTAFEKMSKACNLRQWWMQTLEGAKKSKNLKPLLVFKGNSNEICCIGLADDILRTVSSDGLAKNLFGKKHIPIVMNYFPVSSRVGNTYYEMMVCFQFKTLLKLLVKRAKKHAALYGSERDRDRLRTQDSAARKQVQEPTRPSRKDRNARVRSATSKRIK